MSRTRLCSRAWRYIVATMDDLAAWVADKAEELIAGLTCVQFPGGGSLCPSSPSAAFVDG